MRRSFKNGLLLETHWVDWVLLYKSFLFFEAEKKILCSQRIKPELEKCVKKIKNWSNKRLNKTYIQPAAYSQNPFPRWKRHTMKFIIPLPVTCTNPDSDLPETKLLQARSWVSVFFPLSFQFDILFWAFLGFSHIQQKLLFSDFFFHQVFLHMEWFNS